MKIQGYSSNLFGWKEKYKAEGRAWDIGPALQEIRESGFEAIEDAPSEELLVALQGSGLRMSAGYVGLDLHKPAGELRLPDPIRTAGEQLQAAGAGYLIVNADPKGSWSHPEFKTEDELKRQGENLSLIADIAREYGLRTCFHNHAEELVLCDGDLRSVIQYASGEVLLCLDTAWAWAAGIQPLNWIREYPKRIAAVHLRNANGSVPTEDLLEGEISMAEIMDALKAVHYEGWLTLELWHRQDTGAVRSMKEDSLRSIKHLRNLGAMQ